MKNVFKYQIAVILTILFNAENSYGQVAEVVQACENVYIEAVANIKTSARKSVEFRTLYDHMCSGRNVKDGLNLSASFSSVLDSFSEGLGLGFGSTKEKQEQFCSTYTESAHSLESVQNFERTVVVESLANFNSCISMGNNGVRIQHDSSHPERVFFTFNINREKVDKLIITGLATSDNVSCTSNPPSSKLGKSPVAHSNDFTITCVRTKGVEDGSSVFHRGHISLATNKSEGPYSVTILEDRQLQPELASESNKRISELTNKNLTLEGNLVSAQEQIKSLNQRLESVDARVIHMKRGDSIDPYTPFTDVNVNVHRFHQEWIQCKCFYGDPDPRCNIWGRLPDLNELCRQKVGEGFQGLVAVTNTARSGGSCGFSTLSVVCIKK